MAGTGGSRRWAALAVVAMLVILAAAIASPAQTFATLAYFTDGSTVFSSLIQGTDGNLYGTSNNGGANGYGSVFKVTPTGILTTLYSFCGEANCADGFYPFSALALGTDGDFYGTTQNGGADGMGTVFKVTPNGSYTVLHSFDGTDGSSPEAALIQATDGNFYGTTPGTVFKITPGGTLTTLYSFSGTDGTGLYAALIQGADGNLYGTTHAGGIDNIYCEYDSCGTVFKITPGGTLTTLHRFDFADGANPYSPLVQASNGVLYGTTFEGGYVHFNGCPDGCGTIFEMTTKGTFSTVHKFRFGDGGNLYAGLVQATDGNLYGESPEGGTEGSGEIFEVTTAPSLTAAYSFTAASGGGGVTALFQGTGGKFYGTYGSPGAVFSLDLGLGPFVTNLPTSRQVGQRVAILGNNLTGATSVSFNGTPATFSVVSSTEIATAVPSGATTGTVQVVTPRGTLSSNVPFRVRP